MADDVLARVRAACLALPDQVAEDPERFFVPPYVGGRGWLGVRRDRDLDEDEVAAICTEAYRTVAPKRLVAQLDALP